MGLPNFAIYTLGKFPLFAPHYPYYDIISGCNSNDVTAAFGTGFFCAQSGYDLVTGWGSANMLQLAWGINSYFAGDFIAPNVNFFGPAPNVWYNTNQNISWTVADVGHDIFLPNGVAGFSQAWDTVPFDITDRGLGSLSFFNGPQFPNATTGFLPLSAAGQGCHVANVRVWDNGGTTADRQSLSYCYDTVPPVTTANLTGTFSGGIYTSNVTVTLSATDASSGVSQTFYSLNGKPFLTYTAPFVISAPGTDTLRYYSTDVAGNTESTHSTTFAVKSISTATTVIPSVNPSAYGQSVTFTATVSAAVGGAPTGTVTFRDGATVLGAGALSGGHAVFTTNALLAGSHSITASYSGGGNDLASSSPTLLETVNKATTTTALATSVNPSAYLRSVTFTATIVSQFGGPVGGSVTFKDGATVLGTVAVNSATNKAGFATTALLAGVHSMTAVYSGGGERFGSTSPVLTETVNKATTTTTLASSVNPSAYLRSVTFTATIVSQFGGPVGGSVTFKDGATVLGTVAVNSATNKAAFTTTALLAGVHSMTAVYGGGGERFGSTSAVLTETVNKATTTTTVVSSLNPSTHGTAVTFTATIVSQFGGPVGGSVTFKDGATILGTVAVNSATNKAAFTTSALAVGAHSITAVYGGGGERFGSTSAVLTQTVKP